jgi:hypothetical protein
VVAASFAACAMQQQQATFKWLCVWNHNLTSTCRMLAYLFRCRRSLFGTPTLEQLGTLQEVGALLTLESRIGRRKLL